MIILWFSFDLTDMREMRFETTELEKYTACQGDLLICEGGYPGRAAIWDDPQPIYFQKAIHRVRFLEPSHTKWFLYFLYFLDLTGEIRQYFTGAGIQHFTGRILGKVRIPLLSLDEINYYVVIFEASKSNIDYLSTLNKKKLGLLTKLKQSILHQAFTGQLTNTPTEALKAAGL